MRRDSALGIADLSRHQYYRRPAGKCCGRGRRPSTHTPLGDGSVCNGVVLQEIALRNSNPDLASGYKRMAAHLQVKGYRIGKEKVRRLMREGGTLAPRVKAKGTRQYVRYRNVAPSRPLEVVEMDIKVKWTAEQRRNVYILTILDTFTRLPLAWKAGYSMTKAQVKAAWTEVILNHLQPSDLLSKDLHVEVRSDNGPQFTAREVGEFLGRNHLGHVFTHPYTPQENGHIESFHSILSAALGQDPFWNLEEVEQRLVVFYFNYAHHRIHGSTAGLPPALFLKCWENGLVERRELSPKKVRFRLKVSRHQLSGNESLKGVLSFKDKNIPNWASKPPGKKEVNGPDTPHLQPSVQRSPSVVLS